MKITLLLIAFAFVLSSPAMAQEFKFPIPVPQTEELTPAQPVVPQETVEGSIPKAVRSGQPLQMINPLAPARFGDGRDAVTRDPKNNKPKGFKLFTFNF